MCRAMLLTRVVQLESCFQRASQSAGLPVQGFIPVETKTGGSPVNRYILPGNWHQSTAAWRLVYCRPGLQHKFTLEVHRNGLQCLVRLIEHQHIENDSAALGNVCSVQVWLSITRSDEV